MMLFNLENLVYFMVYPCFSRIFSHFNFTKLNFTIELGGSTNNAI